MEAGIRLGARWDHLDSGCGRGDRNADRTLARARLSSAGYLEVSVTGFGGNQYVALAFDMDGDGLADPMVYHVSNALLTIMLSTSGYGIINVPL